MGTSSDKQATEEQRQFLQAELRVYYGPHQQNILSGFSIDVSSGGLFLETDIAFSVDDMVMLSFTLPDINKTVNCKAKVAWVNLQDNPTKEQYPPGIGLQFIDPSTEYLDSIKSLLKHKGVVPKS